MKKFILVLIILFTINVQAPAQLTEQQTISAIENIVFGYDYNGETDIKRIERIEKNLYGEKKKGTIQKRLENIQNDTGLTVNKPEIAKQDKTSIEEKRNEELKALKEDASVEYPIVDRMEEELFGQTYKSENIYSRLDRLETKVFNQKSNKDLNSRVDKLASILQPSSRRIEQEQYDYNQNPALTPIDNQSVPFQLAVLEEDLLKKSFINENISNRLSRLENKLFNRTYSTDSDINRLQRIMVAYEAKQNSYKYENNRKMQNMATASQLGGILLMLLAILL